MSPQNDEVEPQASRARDLIESGSAIGGAATGAALSFVAGPLVGGPVGTFVGRVFRRVGLEIHDRLLGPRQRIRAGAAFREAAVEIQARLEAGDALRDDGFFQEQEARRPDADEVLEGVLVQAADAYEERKVPYIGKLYASLAFRRDISPPEAHLLLRLAGRLSYRQLTCLAFFAEKAEDDELSDLDADREEQGFRPLPGGMGQELEEAGELGLLGVRQTGGQPVKASATYDGGDMDRQRLGNVVLLPRGAELHDLMGLASIPQADKDTVMETFREALR